TFNINQGDFASGEPSEPSPVQKPVKVKINNGNEVTTSTDVTVNLITGGNTERLRISNSKDLEVKKTKTIPFDGNGIETFKDKTEWNICYPENSCEEGVYKVFVKYESFGGLSSKVVSDSIEYQKPAMDKKEETKKEDSTETQRKKGKDKKQKEDTRAPQKNKEEKQRSKNKSSNVPNFSRNLELGNEGPAVKKLQVYLNNHGYKLAKKGPGSPGNETNYFGPKTRRALKEFQVDHSSKILAPVGLENATGYFGPSTRSFINSNSSVEFSKDRSSSFSYTFKSEHDIGDTGPEVKALQKALDLENCFDYKSYTGYFGPITKKGVKCFQEKYEKDVLNPWNLDKGTGFFGSTTIEKMNELY
ncbi:MAG: peptidoglycan-binding protein, partial [Candidatus Magasanikbacteria bacterium]